MNEKIFLRLKTAIDRHIFPGAVVGVAYKDGERQVYPCGHFTYEVTSPEVTADTVYDIASLTKSLAGAAALLKLIDERKLDLRDKVFNFVPGFGNSQDKKEVTIWHLLTYTLDLGVPSMSTLKDKTADEISEAIISAALKSAPGGKFQYVNSTAFFAHLIVEKISGQTLDTFCQENFFKPLCMKDTMWRPIEAVKKNIPPTEIDAWRGRTIQGEVHDESTFVLQNKYKALAIAGLFSTVPDILTFQEMLLNGGQKEGKNYFSAESVRLMHTDQFPKGSDHPALGFITKELSFMGTMTSDQAFAKTGFTGCLMITDPVKNIAMTFLSNSTYPKRPASKDSINKVRGEIADIVFGG